MTESNPNTNDTDREKGSSFPTPTKKKSVTIDSLSMRELQKIRECLDEVVSVGRSLTISLSSEYEHRDVDYLSELRSAVLERMEDAPTPDETRQWERLYEQIPSEYDGPYCSLDCSINSE